MKTLTKVTVAAIYASGLVLSPGAWAQEAQTPINIVSRLAKKEPASIRVMYPAGGCLVSANTTNPSTVKIYGSNDSSGTSTAIASEWGSYKVVQSPANGFGPLCGAHVLVGDERYDLVQFHFHTPSEHTFNGVQSPVEVHFVHINSRDGCSAGERPLLVVGAFINPGDGKELDRLFEEGSLPKSTSIDLASLLPAQPNGYIHYDGSLTAPNTDCSWREGGKLTQLVTGIFPEAVNWYVLSDVLHLSSKSIERLRALFPEGNARPVKPLNERSLYRGVR